MDDVAYIVKSTTIGGKLFAGEVVTRDKLVSIGCTDERIQNLLDTNALATIAPVLEIKYARQMDSTGKKTTYKRLPEGSTDKAIPINEIPLSVIAKDTKTKKDALAFTNYLHVSVELLLKEYATRKAEYHKEFDAGGDMLASKETRYQLICFEVECSVERLLKHMEEETRKDVLKEYRDGIASLRKLVK